VERKEKSECGLNESIFDAAPEPRLPVVAETTSPQHTVTRPLSNPSHSLAMLKTIALSAAVLLGAAEALQASEIPVRLLIFHPLG
jgi:hypothetical protein